jgi:hypothetical protein
MRICCKRSEMRIAGLSLLRWLFSIRQMVISATPFKVQSPDLICKVEVGDKPWENLRALGGRADAAADESVIADEDFEALRWR